MKLDFEKWLDGQGMPEKARDFFNEAIICFKVSAYRGAFMLSYLGFQTIIRERLLLSDPPGTHLIPNTSRWAVITGKLREPTEWDAEVNLLISDDNSNSEKNIFMIHKDVRKEAVYFKDKRNACVHGKDDISYTQVESLWMFIRNHSGKFMVNSGIEGFIQQVKLHFNPRENDPNAPFDELLSRMTSVVHDDQYHELFKRLFQEISLEFNSKSYKNNFWHEIANNKDDKIRENFLQYLRNDLYDFGDFVLCFPDTLRFFTDDESTLRKFWHDRLHMMHLYKDHISNLYHILDWLFANKKIPESEWNDFWKKCIQQGTLQWLINYRLPEEFIELLRKYGFFQTYREVLLQASVTFNNQFWYRQEDLLPIYLSYSDLDPDFVAHLNKALGSVYSGTFTKKISEVFYVNEERIRNEYRATCEQLGIRSYFD